MTRSGEENTVMHLSREDQEWLDGTLDRIVKKMEAVRERNAEKIPAVAVKGVYDDRADQSIEWDMDNGINWWTNGFWGGIMWQLYHYTGDQRYMEIAMLHADTVAENFIRKDGSVRHIVEFDPVTGEMVRELGGQGYAEGTSWTRGQTWAIYGFAISFRHTKKESYLEAAKKAADRFLSRIPADWHIPVDFDQPEDPHIEDSTAAAVAAGGFLELSRMIPDRAEAYRNAGIRLLKTLAADRCDFSPEIDGILSRCTGSYHGEKDREVNFVYADYYFIEALLKLKGCDVKIW